MSYGPGWKLVKQRQHELAEAKKLRRVAPDAPPERPAASTAAIAPTITADDEGPNLVVGGNPPLPEPLPERTAAPADESGDLRNVAPPAQPSALPIAELTEAIRALTALVARQAASPPRPMGDLPEGLGDRLVRVERALVEFAEKMAELRGSERSLAGLAKRVSDLEQSELSREPPPAADLGPVLDRLAKLERAGDAAGGAPVEQLRKLSLLVAEHGRQLQALDDKAKAILAAAEAVQQATPAVALKRIEATEQTLARVSSRLAQIESDSGARRPAKVNSWPQRAL